METISQAVTRLHEQGYTGQCRAEPGGLRFLDDGALVAAEAVVVEEVVRLEGTSTPDEQAVVFAVRSPDGDRRATFCVTYGPDMDPDDCDIMQRLDVRPAP